MIEAISAAVVPSSFLHRRLVDTIHEQALSFARLRYTQSQLGRGAKQIAERIHKLIVNSYSGVKVTDLEHLAESALSVKPERVALPEIGATCDPGTILKGQQLYEFNNMIHNIPVTPLGPVPKPCHKIAACDEIIMNYKLLSNGMAVLIPLDRVPRDCSGALLKGGLFAVVHKTAFDRLINDRRPLNMFELRLAWAKLPHGSQLTQIIVKPDEVVLGSGDDLSSFFYTLKHHVSWLPRNCFGSPVRGDEYVEFGGEPGQMYMLAFIVICMGDCNAVDLAQGTHHQLLRGTSVASFQPKS
jgi:hypothetical protein